MNNSVLIEERYEVLFKNAREPIFVLDMDSGKFNDFNQRATDFFQLSRNELMDKSPHELSPETVFGQCSKDLSFMYLNLALEGNNPVFDWIHLGPDGEEIPCEISLTRFPPLDRKLIRASIIDRRTEFQLAESLKQTNDRLQLALSASGLGCFDWDVRKHEIHWDVRMCEIFGIPHDSLQDRNEVFFNSIHEEDRERVLGNFQMSMASKEGPSNFLDQYKINLAGEVRFIESAGYLQRNAQGAVERVVGTCNDITDKAMAESNFQAVLENTVDIVLSVNSKYQVLTANTNCRRIMKKAFEIDLKEGESFLEFLPAEIASSWQDRYDRALMGESLIEQDHFENEEMSITMEMAMNPIILKNRVAGVSIIARDITERLESIRAMNAKDRDLAFIYESTTDHITVIRVENDQLILDSVNHKILDWLRNSLQLKFEITDMIGAQLPYIHNTVFGMSLEDSEQILEKYRKVVRTKKEHRLNESFEAGATTFYYETTLNPVIENGQVVKIIEVVHDITETKLAAVKLQEALDEVTTLKARLEDENTYLRKEIDLENNFEEMVYASNSIKMVLNQVEQVAHLNAKVLITGETGTGKELIARAIHALSPRNEKPMIKINCGALPAQLIESELFGYDKGAFTGAVQDKPGRFELAHNSSLLLDEIGELPLGLQVKLLRVIQEGEFERLGGTKTIKVDVRIIAATCRNLKAMVEEGKFREDLFFRLNVFPIEIPPLRSRPEDIPILVEHFAAKLSAKHGKQIKYISDNAMSHFMSSAWPGNVRELENTIERAVILANDDSLHVPEIGAAGSPQPFGKNLTINQVQKLHITKVLELTSWKIEGRTGAAHVLGFKPSTLRDQMKKLGISRSS